MYYSKLNKKYYRLSKRFPKLLIISTVVFILGLGFLARGIFDDFRTAKIEPSPSPEIACNPLDSIKKANDYVVKIVSGGGSGSGFLISPLGFIVTNYHVVKDTSSPHIVFPGNKTIRGQLYNWDEDLDLAIVQITDSPSNSLYFGNSDVVSLGEDVYSIGFPYSELLEGEATVTKGSLSARRKSEDGNIEYIQTDAALNSGNSGGPTINTCGEVIGVNTFVISETQGIGFALSSNSIRFDIDRLIGSGPKKLERNILEDTNLKALGPKDMVLLHYGYISMRQLEKAYDLFSQNIKAQANFEEYKKGFDTTVNLYLNKIEFVDEKVPKVFIEFTAADIYNEQVKYTIYSGTWDLVYEDGVLKLDRPNIVEI